MHTDTKIYKLIKVYLLKIPLTFSEVFTLSQHFSTGESWASGSEGFQPKSSHRSLVMVLWTWQIWDYVSSERYFTQGDAVRSPLWSRRAQRVSLKTAVHRVARWLTLVISKFPSWLQSRLVITGILKISVTLVLFHSGYDPGNLCSKAVKGWLSRSPPWPGNRSS